MTPTIALVVVMGTAAHDGPGLTFPIAFVLPPGTTLEYDLMPVIGEPIGGEYQWMRLSDGRGFVHRSLLRPA